VGSLWDNEMGMPRDEARSGALAATWIGLIAFVACLAPAAYLFPRLEHMRFYNLFPDAFPPRGSAAGGIPATARVYVEPGFARLVPLLETAVALVVAGTAVSAWASFRRRPGLALTCLVGAMGVGLTAIEGGLLLFEPIRSTVRLAGVLRDELRPGEQILVEGKYEHHAGIGFYTRQRVRIYRGSYGILMHGSRYADSAGTFVSEEEFARLWRGPGRAYLVPTPRIACPGCGSWPRPRSSSAAPAATGCSPMAPGRTDGRPGRIPDRPQLGP
jgi:hypothetical protein